MYTDISARIPNRPQQRGLDVVNIPFELRNRVSGEMCPGEFMVTTKGSSCRTNEISQPPPIMSSTSPVTIRDLDLCNFTYNFTVSFSSANFTGASDTIDYVADFTCKFD